MSVPFVEGKCWSRWLALQIFNAPVAQFIRAIAYGAIGREWDSLLVHHFMKQPKLPPVDREKVFAAVDASNKRFVTYTKEQREQFRREAKKRTISGRGIVDVWFMKTDKRDDALIEVWNRLAGMWSHDQDGSAFCPCGMQQDLPDHIAPKSLKDYISTLNNEAKLFAIVFNELQHTIKDAVSPERQDELHK